MGLINRIALISVTLLFMPFTYDFAYLRTILLLLAFAAGVANIIHYRINAYGVDYHRKTTKRIQSLEKRLHQVSNNVKDKE